MKFTSLNPSPGVRKLNPHLFAGASPATTPATIATGTRIRQRAPTPLNRLEQELFDLIKDQYPNYPPVRPQAKRYRLANGASYTPDFTCSSYPCLGGCDKETAWEVKGPKQARWSRRGELTIKMAAAMWPEVRWVLCWKEGGGWRTQEVLP